MPSSLHSRVFASSLTVLLLVSPMVGLATRVVGETEPGQDEGLREAVYLVSITISSDEMLDSLVHYFPHIKGEAHVGSGHFEAGEEEYELAADFLKSVGAEARKRGSDGRVSIESDDAEPRTLTFPPKPQADPAASLPDAPLYTCKYPYDRTRQGDEAYYINGDVVKNHSDQYYNSSICLGIGISPFDAWGEAIWNFDVLSNFTHPQYCYIKWSFRGKAHDTFVDQGDIRLYLRDFQGYYGSTWSWQQVAVVGDEYYEGEQWVDTDWLIARGWNPSAFINSDGRTDIKIGSDEHYEVDWVRARVDYGYTGCVRVNIEPAGAVSDGAKWYLDGNGPYNDNQTVCDVLVGNHTVSFSSLSCWNKPSNQTVNVQADQTATPSGTYSYRYASVTVNIQPSGAVSDGARWSLYESGSPICTNKSSGQTCSNLEAGSYEVRFSSLSCWDPPGNQSFTLSCNEDEVRSGTYDYRHSSVTVNIQPSGAVGDGARWSLYKSGSPICTNKSSGQTCSNLEAGPYEVRFSSLSCWDQPGNQSFTLSCNEDEVRDGTYGRKQFRICVNIEPAAARAAGAQWKLSDGSWRNSDECETRDWGNSYTIQFREIDGWQKCSDQTITLQCQDFNGNCTYSQLIGSICGEVRAQTCNGSGVEGVEVCASGPGSGCDITDANGYFEITGLPYGPYTLTPDVSGGHNFDPVQWPMSLSEPIECMQDCFMDQTIFNVSGDVLFDGTPCGSEGVTITITGNGRNYQTATLADGSWGMAVLIGYDYTVCAAKPGHTFEPACQYDVDVVGDVSGIHFDDMTTHTLSGKVAGGCDISLGQAQLSISSANGCHSLSPWGDAPPAVTYSVDLPPMVYIVDAEIPSDPLIEFDATEVDLTVGDNNLDFIHRNPVEIEFTGFPDLQGSCTVPVMEQGNDYFIQIHVFERYGDEICPVESGDLTIYDHISDQAQTTVPIVDGVAEHTISAGQPNILGGGDHPYQKQFEVFFAEEGVGQDQWAIVTGYKLREETYTTVTPEIPIVILRDPPADASYSALTTTTNLCYNASLYFQAEGSVEVSAKTEIGLDLGLGDIGGSIKGRVEVGAGLNVRREWGVCATTATTYSTPDGESLVGPDGDVFAGAAISLVYAIADVLALNENCEVEIDQAVAYNGDGYETTFIYTANHIREGVIPELQWLADNTSNPDSVQIYLDSKALWQEILDLNEELKSNAEVFQGNFSFDSELTWEETRSITENTMVEFYMFVNSDVAATAELEVLGSGGELGVKVRAGLKVGLSVEKTEVNTNRVLLHLEDNDTGDNFTVDIKRDRVYGTPVFDLISGKSSCPWEHPTQPRECVDLSIDPSEQYDVPAGEAAVCTLYIGNCSPSGDTRTYCLSVVEESNPNGAVILVDGNELPRCTYTVPAHQVVKKTMTIEKGPTAVCYPDLRIRLGSGCGDSQISDTASFSVCFVEGCSPVSIAIPDSNWVISGDANDSLRVVISDYDPDHSDLLSIDFQYREVGGGSWITAWSVARNDLPNTYIDRYWDVSALSENPEGTEYEIRAVTVCEAARSYSEVLPGVIDRIPPDICGSQPADDVLSPGDEISFTFCEPIDCATANALCCSLKYLGTGMPIDISVTCDGTKVTITPNIASSLVENQNLEACVTCVEDLHGNPLGYRECRSFYVDLGPLHWNPDGLARAIKEGRRDTLVSQLRNSGPSTVSFSLSVSGDGVCTPDPISGALSPAGGSREIEFAVGPLTARDKPYIDTVWAGTSGWPAEQAIITVNILPPCPYPGWSVNPSEYDYDGTITAAVFLDSMQVGGPGDSLAAFVGNECRGVTESWKTPENTYIFSLAVFSNQPSGELMHLKYFDASTCTTHDLYAEFTPSGRIEFISDMILCSSTEPCVLVIQPPYDCVSIPLNEGWNWVSLNVDCEGMPLDSVLASLEPADSNYIKTLGSYAEYVLDWNGWYGSLTSLECERAYLLRMRRPDTLSLCDIPCDVSDPIELKPGWNWISYLPPYCLLLGDALASLEPVDSNYIKTLGSYAEYVLDWDGWYGTLEEMCPLVGYKIKMINADTLVYPDESIVVTSSRNMGRLGKAHDLHEVEWSFDPSKYEFTGSVTCAVIPNEHFIGSEGDVLAAFSDDGCRGMARPLECPNGDQVFFLMVHTNEPAGETLKLKYHSRGNAITYDVKQTLEFMADMTLGFAASPYMLTVIPGQDYDRAGGAVLRTSLHRNQPDPFAFLTQISFSVAESGPAKIEIFNTQGECIRTLASGHFDPGVHSLVWDGSNDSGTPVSSGIYFCRLTTPNLRAMEKLVLLK